MSADYATSWVAGAGTWSRVLTIGGLPFIVTDTTKRCGANGCGVVLRLRRSVEKNRCCCCRGCCSPLYDGTEPECDECGALLMAEDTHPTLCSDCSEVAG